jgi:Glycoside hydrolase 123, catalytic domain
VTYHGGAIVTVNGREVARKHLPSGALAAGALAEGYPEEAYLTPKGTWLQAYEARGKADAELARRLALRERTLSDVAIPAKLLRRGMNVIAIEIVRAPYHKVVEERKNEAQARRRGTPYVLCFNTCEFTLVQVTSKSAAGLEPNVARPKGLQVWSSDVLLADFDMDYGDRAAPLAPVRIVGTRNGAFSGKVVVGSDKPLEGLRATISDLRGPGGATIPASAVRIRYALPWGGERGVYWPHYGSGDTMRSRYSRRPTLLSALSEAPPEAVAVAEKRAGRYDLKTPNQVSPSPGAVVPVWMTIGVGKDAAAGTYAAQVTIEAKGHPAMSVPVVLTVEDWTLPDPQDYRTWVELTQSPDTLSIEYGLKPWSDEHWRMIGRSLALLKEVGSGVLYVPLVCRTNLGNDESMVRWIPKADGSYEYDFSVMDKYLDVAEKSMGRPKIVCFVVWDIYMCPKKQIKGRFDQEFKHVIKAREALKGVGPAVTVVDRASGKLETVYLPPFTEARTQKLWWPLLEQLQKKMTDRKLKDVMMLGLVSDAWPVKAEDAFFTSACPGVPWVSHSHLGVRHGRNYSGANFQNCPINTAYETRIINTEFPYSDPANGSMSGWQQENLVAQHERHAAEFPASRWRHIAELNITGRQRGIGRLGGDVWRCVKDRHGRRRGRVDERFPESFWRNLNFSSSLLAPGAKGAVATYRYEALREGVQECEARILIEEAVADEALRAKLGEELVARCRALLVERTQCLLKAATSMQLSGPAHYTMTSGRIIRYAGPAGHYWFVGSLWQDRTAALFRLAGEVARKLGRQ